MTAPDPLECMAVRAAHDESLCSEPESAHCQRCELCPGACICPRELTPGKYRMAVEVEVDEHGFIYPHDTALMLTAEWWQQRNASFTETSAYAAILAGRRNRAAETERLRGQVQEQQAELNRLTVSPDPAMLPSARELVDAWNRRTDTEQLALADQFLIPVTVTRTEGADIPAGHYEVLVIPTGQTEFVPITELVPHHRPAEVNNLKHSKENS